MTPSSTSKFPTDSLLRWGILSTGHIAGVFAQGLQVSRTGRVAAVASRSKERATAFAEKHSISRSYGTYQELLRDPSVDAVYIAVPHPLHAPWAIRAAEAGKHILCEKPLTMDRSQAVKVISAARRAKVFLMEAFMYRCHPQTTKLLELIRGKKIGDVRLIQASFCFDRPLGLKHRLFNRKLGGGGILDVGCYPLSMARLIAGAALGLPFAEPLSLKGTAVIGRKSGVDEMALASLKFPGGILAEISCGIALDRGIPLVKIEGTKGSLTVLSPWHAKREGGTSYFLFQKHGDKKASRIPITCEYPLSTVEADQVGESIQKGDLECTAMTWKDTLGNMKALDKWRRTSRIH